MKNKTLRALLLVMLALFFALPFSAGAEPDNVSALFLNVGKADATLLFIGDKTYMIDTGTELRASAMLHALETQGVTRLEGVIITHTHKDHVGGLAALLNESGVAVERLYAPTLSSAKSLDKHPVYALSQTSGVPLTWLNAGDVLTLGKDATATVLGPRSLDPDNENNNSLVLHIVTPRGSMLMTGDMELQEEAELLQASAIPQVTLLKLAHHGKDDANSKQLITTVQPIIAVISTSSQEDNKTPNPTVLARLNVVGARIVVTEDASCGIRIILDNENSKSYLEAYQNIPSPETHLCLTAYDVKEDTVTLSNTGSEAIMLDRYTLYSTKGEQTYRLPDGVTLEGGQSLMIGSQSTQESVDLKWPVKRIWNKKALDAVELYDVFGRLVAQIEKPEV